VKFERSNFAKLRLSGHILGIKNSDAVEMYEENSGTVVLVKQISIKAVYFYTRLKNCFEIRMKEIGL